MKALSFSFLAAILAAGGVLSGCQSLREAEESGRIVQDVPAYNVRGVEARRAEGSIIKGNDSLRAMLLDSEEKQNSLPVNKYLWRASLDTLSFLPIASVDTFSGVIATDWGAAPGAANERVRATAYVRSEELSATALDVTVFREVLGAGGVWQSAPVAASTAEQLEDAILTRARQLRIEDVDG